MSGGRRTNVAPVGLGNHSRRLAGVLVIALPAVVYGGTSILPC